MSALSDALIHDQEKRSSSSKFYDSLEEDNSDISTDSLENERYRKDRSLASGKHKREDSGVVEGKKEGIPEKDLFNQSEPKTRSITTIPLYKGEVTLSHVHKLKENACRGKETKYGTVLTTNKFTKQRKHVKGTTNTTKSKLPITTEGKGAECFLGRWLIQANSQKNTLRNSDSVQNSNGLVTSLMKDLSLTESRSIIRLDTSSSSETINMNESKQISASKSCSSLHNIKRNKVKNFINENRVSCLNGRPNKNISYLKKYQEKKYGLQNMANIRRESPEGSSCSTFGDSTVTCLSRGDLCDIRDNSTIISDDVDDYSFYMEAIAEDKRRSTLYNEEIVLSSYSEIMFEEISQNRGSPRRSYVPYKMEDYRAAQSLPKLGGLGPDHNATKEKYDQKMKQINYGNVVSKRNVIKKHLAAPLLQKPTPERPIHLSVQPPFQPELSATTSSFRPQRNEGNKKAGRQTRQEKKQQQKHQSSVSVDVGTEKDTVNRKKEVALLQTLQQRHLKEVELAEAIRRQMK